MTPEEQRPSESMESPYRQMVIEVNEDAHEAIESRCATEGLDKATVASRAAILYDELAKEIELGNRIYVRRRTRLKLSRWSEVSWPPKARKRS